MIDGPLTTPRYFSTATNAHVLSHGALMIEAYLFRVEVFYAAGGSSE